MIVELLKNDNRKKGKIRYNKLQDNKLIVSSDLLRSEEEIK